MWLGIAGGMLMAVLLAKNVKGSIVIGILFGARHLRPAACSLEVEGREERDALWPPAKRKTLTCPLPPPAPRPPAVTFISWIPSDGNAARYIEKPDGCQPSGSFADGSPCTYTPAMRRWDYFSKVRGL